MVGGGVTKVLMLPLPPSLPIPSPAIENPTGELREPHFLAISEFSAFSACIHIVSAFSSIISVPTLFFLDLARIPLHVSAKLRIIAFLCVIGHILGISSHYFIGMFFSYDPNIYFWSFGNSWKRIPPQIYQVGKASIEFFCCSNFFV